DRQPDQLSPLRTAYAVPVRQVRMPSAIQAIAWAGHQVTLLKAEASLSVSIVECNPFGTILSSGAAGSWHCRQVVLDINFKLLYTVHSFILGNQPKRWREMAAKVKDFPYRVQVLDRALGMADLSPIHGPELTPADLSEHFILHKGTLRR